MNCILHGAVTYSLERLQLESDPCVKYDARRKIWIYLHKSRTINDFGKYFIFICNSILKKKKIIFLIKLCRME